MTRALPVQAAVLALASMVAIVPPSEGNMTIMPAVSGDSDATFRWTIAAGALPVAQGPYPGSVVVHGSLSKILPPALAHGALPVTARFSACGPVQIEERS